MAYYVVGGRYRDTTFREMVRPDPPEGPFARYEDALATWRAKSVRHIDEAFVRFEIVAAEGVEGAGAGRRRG
ncbi:MAG: DUF4170 domain-containing protein [Chloroflexi bacterium]|nr:DUF4170 domain-containing protein [Chloroflexota bacterium]